MRSSEFKKQFMTVTPLSRRIALLMVIFLPFIGFYFGYTYPRNPSFMLSQQSILPPIVQSEPESVAQDFYSLYVNCINIKSQKGGSCEWRNSSYVEKDLATNLAKKNINLTCSSNIPVGVVSKLLSADPNQATVVSYQIYNDGLVKVKVFLKNDNGVWKINDISCPTD